MKPELSADDVAGPTCDGCRFGSLQDIGYSNWTVEGRDFFCLVDAHPSDGFDAWYRTDPRLRFAAECPKFEAGEPVCLNVDREDLDQLTPDQRGLLAAWEKRHIDGTGASDVPASQ